MAEHRTDQDAPPATFLPATPETVHWGHWNANIPPVLHIHSGDRLAVETLSGGPDNLPAPEQGFRILPQHPEVLAQVAKGPGPHLLTGPVYIHDAEPGDILEVHIEDIRLRQDWGWNRQLPLYGALPDIELKPRCVHMAIDIDQGLITLPWGQVLAARPFFGCMGVAPPPHYGNLSSIEPRVFGGNIDNRELVAGTVIQFPVFVPGALFSVGDGHALQGDGEVCLTAIETALSGRFGFYLRKNSPLERPRAVTSDSLITMGFDEDLDTAARIALKDMLLLIMDITGLAMQDAYTLCSAAAHLRITQMVNVQKGVHCLIRLGDLPGGGDPLEKILVKSR